MKLTHPSAISHPDRRQCCRFTHGAIARWAALSLFMAPLGFVVQGEDAVELKNDRDQLSYALGMTYGSQFRRQSIELEIAAFIQGLKDARSGGKTQLTEGEARAMIVGLQEELKKKELAAQAEKLQAENEQAEKNLKEGEAFLAENKSREGVITLGSGLQYKILKAGTGETPTAGDLVVCHYRGTTLDGKEFDSTYPRNKPATMPVKGVIKGWNEALQLMPTGSKWQLFVPSKFAYGARASGSSFGPNSALIFELELLSIEKKSSASVGKPVPAAAVAAAGK